MARASDQSKTGFVTITTVRSRAEAREICDKLKSAGIESLLSVERGAQFSPTGSPWLGGIKVQVSRANVEAALRALQRSRGDAGRSSESVSETPRANSRPRVDLDSWRGAAMAVAAIIALAAVLALWLF